MDDVLVGMEKPQNTEEQVLVQELELHETAFHSLKAFLYSQIYSQEALPHNLVEVQVMVSFCRGQVRFFYGQVKRLEVNAHYHELQVQVK